MTIPIYQDKKIQLDAFWLKIIAIIAMTTDHIAWVFVEFENILFNPLHFVGRLTAPLMCFFLAQGFYFTNNREKYALRLLIFALLSQVPFILMIKSLSWQKFLAEPSALLDSGNVLFNLLNALLVLMLCHAKLPIYVKLFLISVLWACSLWLDWGLEIIAYVLIFAYFRHNLTYQIIGYIICAGVVLLLEHFGVLYSAMTVPGVWFPLGVFLLPICLYLYNGKKGQSLGGRYFFYWYYPVHMMFLVIFSWIL